MSGRSLVEAFWRDVIDARDPVAVDALAALNYRQHAPGIAQGLEGLKTFLRNTFDVSDGMRAEMTDALEVDDLVTCRTTIRFDRPPDGWAAEHPIADVFRTDGARLTEHWDLR